MERYSKTELQESIQSLQSTLRKCGKVLEKLPDHTLTVRRVKALKIAIELMTEKLKEESE